MGTRSKLILLAINFKEGWLSISTPTPIIQGGELEVCARIAKESLLRDINDSSSDKYAKELEEELLEKINKLDIGPMGLGGKSTALAVKVNLHACHIASLPVAVNLQCHASRHKEIILW